MRTQEQNRVNSLFNRAKEKCDVLTMKYVLKRLQEKGYNPITIRDCMYQAATDGLFNKQK